MAHAAFTRWEASESPRVPPGQAAAAQLRTEVDALLAARALTPGSTPPVSGTNRLLAAVQRIGGVR
jgi:hypothetical protein